MKKKLFIMSTIIISAFLFNCSDRAENNILEIRSEYQRFIDNHEFSNRPFLNKQELEAIPKQDRPDLAWEQDFLRTMAPATGKPERQRLIPTIEAINSDIRENRIFSSHNWDERGPYQVGGRTRAIMFDPNDVNAKKVWAGGVNGGIWFNSDITTASSEWTQVFTTMDNFAVCAMDYDPVDTQTFYAGTGEGQGNADAARGAGLWKSENGGTTWTLLNNSTGFRYILDVEVRDESGSEGIIYLATRTPGGIYRSADGGATFFEVYSTTTNDLEIGADNRIWAGTNNGKVIYSDNGITWNESYVHSGGERVEVGLAPSDANYVYAIIESENAVDDIVYTPDALSWNSITEPDDSGDTTIPSDDFSRSQAWYDITLAVRPNDKDEIYVGAINSFKGTVVSSTASYSKISSWSLSADNTVSFSHADQHNFLFRPGFPNESIMSNDGGVFYIPDVSNLENITNGIVQMNKGYNITQFYSCGLNPNSASNDFIGGTQDNGTQQFDGPGIDDTTTKSGGDGGFCFIDQSFPNYKITSFTHNNFILFDDANAEVHDLLTSDDESGSFINPADYDDILNILYTNDGSSINRVKLNAAVEGVPLTLIANVPFSPVSLSGTPTHLRVSPYAPVNTSTLFVGTSNGNVYKIPSADDEGSTPFATNISAGISTTGSVSSIEIGSDEDELLVTFFNYGVTSVWYTSNGGTSWVSKEGDLPDMPVRWALFNPDDREQVILATELGVWATTQLSDVSPTWTAVNTGMGNVRVDMFQYRSSDKTILTATHGRGMFTSTFSQTLSSGDFSLKENYKIFPNPVKQNELLNIKFKNNFTGKFNVVMYDLNGRKVLSKNFDQSANSFTLNVNSLQKGLYILNISSQDYSLTEKIVVR